MKKHLMKKTISVILAFLLISSVSNVFAHDILSEEYVNVALNRPNFSYYQVASTEAYGNCYHADYATDGDLTTNFYTGYGDWYFVDLGAGYPIDNIKINFGMNVSNSDSMTIYLSDESMYGDRKMYTPTLPTDKRVIFDASAATPQEDSEYIIKENEWIEFDVAGSTLENKTAQFVYIEKTGNLIINELEVYTEESNVMENAPYWVEIGAFKPAMAATYKLANSGTELSEEYLPGYANDRNINTSYLGEAITYTRNETSSDPNYRNENLKQKLVIDLEEAYPINAIVYRPMNGYSGGYTIYVTNDPLSYGSANKFGADGLSNPQQVCFTKPATLTENAYRYVIVESTEFTVSAGNYIQKLGISDLLVYTDATETLTEPVRSLSEADNRAHLVSLLKTTSSNYTSTGNYNNVSDGKLTTSFYNTRTAGQDINVVIDLGEPQTIDYITATRGKTADNLNKNIKIFVTNDKSVLAGASEYEANKDKITLVYEKTNEGAMATSSMEVYPVNLTEKYRYVGAWIPRASDGTLSRTNLASLDVYTKTANLDIPGDEEPKPEPEPEPDPEPETELDMTSVTDISKNKAAFAINSLEYTDPSMAVDGNVETSWLSKGAYGLRTDFVIDLGAEYPVAGFGLLPAVEASADNVKIYGANSKMFSDKTLLADVTDLPDPKEGESLTNIVANNESKNSYRYIILERPKESTETKYGFSEIAVYTPNESAAISAQSGAVSLLSKNKNVYLANNADTYNDQTSVAAAEVRKNFVDDDPTTVTGVSAANGNKLRMMVDLGIGVPLSHIVYQYKGGSSYGSNFTIVATNNEDFKSATYTELASVEMPKYDSDANTGILVFPVEDTKAYRYVGLVSTHEADLMRLAASTFGVYAKADDVSQYVGDSYCLAMEESLELIDVAVTYSAELLTGAVCANNVIGIFESSTGKSTYVDSAIIKNGGYNSVKLTADISSEDTWKLAVVNGQVLLTHYTNIASESKSASYEGTEGSSISYEQIGDRFILKGTADAGVAGVLILKPGASLENYGKDDIYAHKLVTAPRSSKEPWSFDLSYDFAEDSPDGRYTIVPVCDNPLSMLLDKTYTFNKVDTISIKEDFKNVSEDNFINLVEKHSDFFADVSEELKAADKENGTIGKSFILAMDAFKQGLFDNYTYTDLNINLISAASKAALVIDATLNSSDFDSVINTHGSVMPKLFEISDYDPDEFQLLFPEVLKVLEYDTAQKLVTAYRRAIGLSLISGGTKQEKENALKNYYSDLGISKSTLECSLDLIEIADELSSDSSTVKTSYIKGMDDVISSIVEELESSDKSGPSVVKGGNNGGGGKFYMPSDDVHSVPPVIGNTQLELDPETGFGDLSGYDWAKKQIALLSQRGIMVGKGNASFDPGALLTREEAVKLLILTMNIDTDLSDNLYLDCVKGSWYYPFVSAAKANNLVNGISNDMFGVGQQVTRQDMAVMIYRALQNMGIVLGGNAIPFADKNEISAYAEEAVAALSGVGIINGLADGSFAPLKGTTRAEAAVIFGRFLNLIEEGIIE